ncbi:unnamed protein product [Prunus armeniaca]
MLTRHAHQGNRNTLLWKGVQCSPHDVVVFAQQFVHEFITVNGTLPKVTNRVQDALKWAAPASCHLKLNFDRAFDPTLGRGAVRVVARDGDGGLALALSLGIASPIFEGDSAVVVATVKRAGHDYSNIGTIVKEVKDLHKQFPGSVFQFTHREANGVVHRLARFGLLTVDNFTWFEVPPDLIQDALFCDVLGRGQA